MVVVRFEDDAKADAFEKYLKHGSGHAFANRHFWRQQAAGHHTGRWALGQRPTSFEDTGCNPYPFISCHRLSRIDAIKSRVSAPFPDNVLTDAGGRSCACSARCVEAEARAEIERRPVTPIA